MSRKETEIDPKSHEFIQLGDFRFSLETRELRKATGDPVTLRRQSADVLAHLATHAGELVAKEALIEAVWADTFVTDDSLVQCIGDIRRALGDDDHKIVQTYSKMGYKLVPARGKSEASASALQIGRLRRRAVPVLGGAIVAVLIAVAVWIDFDGAGAPDLLTDKPTIAVLPFDDFSAGEDRGYLSDAIAEGIITELARNSLIAVTARNSSFRYRGSDKDVRRIGEELGVHYILEGSKQKNGVQLRVTVQLIDATGGTHLWAHTYDQKIGDLFAVQDAIIKTVANRIGIQIERPVPGEDPKKVTALHLYLQGIEIIRNSFNAETAAQVMELNRQAIKADPTAHYGYVGVAHGYRVASAFGWHGLSSKEALEKGFAAAEKALELAPDDAEVHYAMARLHVESNQREKAIAAFNRAIELNPSNSKYLSSSADTMLYAGQTEEGIKRLERAMGIDPFHGDDVYWQMSWALWQMEDCQGALSTILKSAKIKRATHRMLAVIYACLGKVEDAQEAYKVFYAEANEPTISEEREKWKNIWTAPGGLERWLEHLRIAGMRD